MNRIRLTSLALCAALLVTGASKCQSTSDDSASQGTSGNEADGTIDPLLIRCANYRAALDDAKPTKAERRLKGHQSMINSYKRMQKLEAAFAQIFPEAADAANALHDIYVKAAAGTLSKAEEAKIDGYDDKILKAIDANCPNSGYPAN